MTNEPGNYVDKVRDHTARYIRKLLSENARLRILAAELKNEAERIAEDSRIAREELTFRESQEHRIQQTLEDIKRESEEALAQYASLEQQNANLASLYVASYQLHGTLDRAAVVTAMQEIIVNLVGSEEFAIYEVDRDTGRFAPVAGFGERRAPDFHAAPLLDAVRTGEIYLAPAGSPITACIPMKIDGAVTGVVVIYSLLAHKAGIEALDHELFDLLATHGATALYCTSLAAAADERRTA